MAKTFFDKNDNGIRRTVITDPGEIRELKQIADDLQDSLDDPAIVAKHGKCRVVAVDTEDRFNQVWPEVQQVVGDMWGKNWQGEALAEYYRSEAGKKHMDV